MSTDLNFLDEVAGPNTAVPTSDIETVDNASTDNNAENSENADNTENPTGDSKYTNVTATYGSEAEVPEGTKLYTVTEFTAALTVRNIVERNLGVDGVVKDSAVYTAMRAVRHPLSVVLVDGNAFLTNDAFVEWDSRPERGTGAASNGGRLSDDDLLKAANAARDKVDSLNRRMASLTSRLDAAKKLFAKRERQMTDRFNTSADTAWTRVDEWASANEVEAADDNDETEAAA